MNQLDQEILTCVYVLDALHNEHYFISIKELKLTPARFVIIKDKQRYPEPVIKTEPSVFEKIRAKSTNWDDLNRITQDYVKYYTYKGFNR